MRLPRRSSSDNRVSIIVAAYNVEKYIRDCVASIVGQSYKNIEIICIDDCSTDYTRRALEELKHNNPEIILICNESNLGISEVRNIGVSLANGEWICFVDGDDYVVPNMVELLVRKAEISNADLIIGNSYYSVDGEKRRSESFYDLKQDKRTNEQLQIDAILGINGLSTSVGVPWGKLYNRNFLRHNRINFVSGLKRMQDMVFNLNVFQACSIIEYVNEPIYYYRLHGESSIHKYDRSFVNTAENVISEIKKFADQNAKQWTEVIGIKEMHLVIEAVKLCCMCSECNMSLKEKMEFIMETNNRLFDYSKEGNGILGRTMKEKYVFILLHNKLFFLFYLSCWLKIKHCAS